MRINIEKRNRVVYNLYRRETNSLFMVKTKRMVITIIFTEVTEMDLKKIGKFIAVLRKENGYTQEQLGEKIDFYKNKWLKDHIFLIIVAGVCIIGLVIAGIMINKQCLVIAIVMFIIAHCIRYNMMMAYVEKNAYDGTGIENADK